MDDGISRETSCKKQAIHLPPSRDPIPLRYLLLTTGETFEQFEIKYPTIKISRSKFFTLESSWVRERTPHENCLCIHRSNADLLLQASNPSF